jgi:D-alanyl-D-alanine dipeptidase
VREVPCIERARKGMSAYDQPIPIHARAPTAGNYHDIPVDAQDPRYAETLIDARGLGIAGENYYARTDRRNRPYDEEVPGAVPELWVRQSLAAMLATVNDRLAAFGAELYLWDAYRPVACQQALWDFFWSRFRARTPDASEAALADRVRHYVSDPRRFDPNNVRTWPAHATGGAVDLTLRDLKTGALLDMGTHFDDMSTLSHSDHFERLLQAGRIDPDDPRLRNRRLLHWAMREQGFTNYSYEFWHFDYGNQMYAMMRDFLGHTDAGAAWYGYVPPPST